MQNPEFHNHLVAFIVDEAHCVKQWLASGTIFHMHACMNVVLIIIFVYSPLRG